MRGEPEEAIKMRELGSRREIEERDQEYQERTDERMNEAREHEEQLEKAGATIDDMPEPAVTDTVEGLNRIIEQTREMAREQTDEHEQEVTDHVEGEHGEVSEPAREGEEIEREGVEKLDEGLSAAGVYSDELSEMRDVRDDTAEFLSEIAEGSEDHQDLSRKSNQELAEMARATAEALRRF